jgi:hypothetical protein
MAVFSYEIDEEVLFKKNLRLRLRMQIYSNEATTATFTIIEFMH